MNPEMLPVPSFFRKWFNVTSMKLPKTYVYLGLENFHDYSLKLYISLRNRAIKLIEVKKSCFL